MSLHVTRADGVEDLLGVDPSEPLMRRALRLVQSDTALLDELLGRRESLGLTRDDVAQRMGVTPETIAKIESGTADPRLSTLRRYAMAVGAVVEHTVVDQ